MQESSACAPKLLKVTHDGGRQGFKISKMGNLQRMESWFVSSKEQAAIDFGQRQCFASAEED